jgi:hypothetical protein
LVFWIGEKVSAMRAVCSRHSGMTILLGRTAVYAASFSGKMFQNFAASGFLTSFR